MERIKRLFIVVISIFFIFPILVHAGTELGTSTQYPVVGSSIYIQLDLMYGDNLMIRDFHTIITYDPEYFSFERVAWLQSSGSYSDDQQGTIYIDKEAGSDWKTGGVLQLKFNVLKSGLSKIDVKRNGDSHYSDGNIIGQSFAGIYIGSKEPSTQVLLSGLYVNGYDIQPTFNKMHNNYTLSVPSNVDAVNIIAQKGDPNQTITGDGKKLLVYGDNKVHVVVRAQDNTTNTYNINIVRVDDRNGDTTLKTITIGDEVINVEPNKYEYETTVTRSADNILLNARTTDPYATLIGTGRKNLNIGTNKFTLVVESSNGKNQEYLVTINRSTEEFQIIEESNKLQSLKINGINLDLSDDKDKWFYGINNDYDELNISAVTESKTAEIEISGNKNFEPGINVVEIKVTEKKNITKENPKPSEKDIKKYTIIVYKSPTDALLVSSLETIPEGNNIFYRTVSIEDSIINENILKSLNKYNKKLYYNVVNMYNGVLYQAVISNVKDDSPLDVSFKETSSKHYETSLPKDVEILLNVENNFFDGVNVKIYTYSGEDKGDYTLLTDGLTVQNGYIHFKTNGDTHYIISNYSLIKEQGPFAKFFNKYKFIFLYIILGILIIGLLIYIISTKINKKKPSMNIEY